MEYPKKDNSQKNINLKPILSVKDVKNTEKEYNKLLNDYLSGEAKDVVKKIYEIQKIVKNYHKFLLFSAKLTSVTSEFEDDCGTIHIQYDGDLYFKHMILGVCPKISYLMVKNENLCFLNFKGGTEATRPLVGIYGDSPEMIEQNFFRSIEKRSVFLSQKLYSLKGLIKGINR